MDAITLTWDKPYGKTELKNYEISYGINGERPKEPLFTQGPDRIITMKELLSGTTYKISVRGISRHNKVGNWSTPRLIETSKNQLTDLNFLSQYNIPTSKTLLQVSFHLVCVSIFLILHLHSCYRGT